MAIDFEVFVRESLGDKDGNAVKLQGVSNFLGVGIPGVPNLGDAITDGLTSFFSGGPGGGDLTGFVQKLIGQLIDLVVDNALKAVDPSKIKIGSLPLPMKSGGLDGLNGLSEVRHLLNAID